jgi:membrane associated rhomboid family serine protease
MAEPQRTPPRTTTSENIVSGQPKPGNGPSMQASPPNGSHGKQVRISMPASILKQSNAYGRVQYGKEGGAKKRSGPSARVSVRGRRQSGLVIASNPKNPKNTKVISKHRSSMFSFQPVPHRAQSNMNTNSKYSVEEQEDVDDDEFGEGKDPSDPEGDKESKIEKKESSGVVYAVYEPEHKPIFIHSMVMICIIVCFYELYYNGTNRAEDNPCPIKFWKFCLEDTKTNPFFGPSTDTLKELGAKTGYTVVIENETQRLFTCMFLHGGLVHLSFNMLALCQMGLGIERSYGTFKVAIIYLISGLFGSITSTIFDPDSVGVGASGAIFGLFGAAWGDLIQNWELYEGPQYTLLSLAFGTLFNLGIGTAPYLDNFAHFFGFVMGVLLSLGLLVVERQTSSGKHLKLNCCHVLLEFVPVLLVPFLLVIGLGVLYSGISGHDACSWCTKINCVPFPWGCDVHEEGACVWDCNTCLSSGVTADATLFNNDVMNATVTLHCPLLSDWTSPEIEDIVLREQDVSKFDHSYLLKVCRAHCPDAFL